MVFSYHIRYTFRNQSKGAFLLSADLHQKSRSGSNQYKFLVVRVLRFRELGRSEVCLRFVRRIKNDRTNPTLATKAKIAKAIGVCAKELMR
jgi:hypothetical protein